MKTQFHIVQSHDTCRFILKPYGSSSKKVSLCYFCITVWYDTVNKTLLIILIKSCNFIQSCSNGIQALGNKFNFHLHQYNQLYKFVMRVSSECYRMHVILKGWKVLLPIVYLFLMLSWRISKCSFICKWFTHLTSQGRCRNWPTMFIQLSFRWHAREQMCLSFCILIFLQRATKHTLKGGRCNLESQS